MTYNNKAKLKTLYVRQILEEETDAERGLSMRQIIERLEQHEIKAERKSVYRDLEVLREFGCDICSYQRNPVEYALIRRQFKLPELMLMVDAVQSNKALTVRQSTALETNIKLIASDHDRALMERKIHVPGRIKTNADSVFGNVDVIHGAMRLKRKVEFAYHRRNIEGERREARGGRPHALTPVEVNHADGFQSARPSSVAAPSRPRSSRTRPCWFRIIRFSPLPPLFSFAILRPLEISRACPPPSAFRPRPTCRHRHRSL